MNAAEFVFNAGYGIVQRKEAAVALRIFVAEFENEVAKGACAARTFFPRAEKNNGVCHAVFGYLYAVCARSAEYAGAEMGVAQRQRPFFPACVGLIVYAGAEKIRIVGRGIFIFENKRFVHGLSSLIYTFAQSIPQKLSFFNEFCDFHAVSFRQNMPKSQFASSFETARKIMRKFM